MTKRHLGRHRAMPARSNPLGSISKAVSSNAGSVGRQAAVIAAASGLVLTIGVPADATPATREAAKAPAADILRTSMDAPAAVTVADAKPQELKQIRVSVADVKSTDGSAHRAALRKAAAEREAAEEAAAVEQQAAQEAAAERQADRQATPMTRESRQASTPTQTATSAGTAGTVTTASAPKTVSAPKKAEAPSASSAGLSGIAAMAMSYKGAPYVWGGTSPSGWDCSGFIQYIYGKAGISLPHNTTAIRTSGKFVRTSTPKPGDLVYQNGGSHAGIYIGGGQIIGAQNPSVGTVVRPADSPYGPLMGYYTYVG